MQKKFSTLDMQTKWCSDLEIDALAQLHKIKINVLQCSKVEIDMFN
jgi:hypothetical protein